MTAKEYLNQAIKISKSIQTKHELIIKLREQATNITASYDAEMVSSSPQNKIETTVVKIEQLRSEIIADSERLITVQRDIYHTIESLENSKYKRILTQKYLLGKNWETIASENNYSWQHVHRLHGEVLTIIENNLQKNKHVIECE